jgi:hypothetical protein
MTREQPPLDTNHTLGTVVLAEVLGTTSAGSSNITIGVERDELALIIHPEGMGTWDGSYAPVLLERHVGKIRLVVWADINQQDPTHIIDLSGALESRRAAHDRPVAISERA